MNFDADRLSRLAGLPQNRRDNLLSEGAVSEESAVVAENEETVNEETCAENCDNPAHDHMVAEEVLFEIVESADAEHEDAMHEEEMYEEMEEDMPESDDNDSEVSEASSALSLDQLRETVLELRDEILAEQQEEKRRIFEQPIRDAIRREIKSLLSAD